MEGVDDVQAFNTIEEISTRLDIDQETREAIREIYTMFGPMLQYGTALKIAGSIYIGCRRESNLRTLREIAYSFDPRLKLPQMRSVKRRIIRLFEREEGIDTPVPEFAKGFCAYLQIGGNPARAAHEAMQRFSEQNIQIFPIAAAAAMVYVTSALSGVPVISNDICRVSGVSEQSLAAAFAGLANHLAQLVPEWDAADFNGIVPPGQ